MPGNEYCRMAPRDIRAKEDQIAEFAREATEKLLDLPNPPTGIFFHTESYMLDGAMQVIQKRGLVLDKDISVLGLALPGDEGNAPFDVFVEDAETLGREIVATAMKLAKAPYQVFHVDVPMKLVGKATSSASVPSHDTGNRGEQ